VAYTGATAPNYGADSTLAGSSTVAAGGSGGNGGASDPQSGASLAAGANGGKGLMGTSTGILQIASM